MMVRLIPMVKMVAGLTNIPVVLGRIYGVRSNTANPIS